MKKLEQYNFPEELKTMCGVPFHSADTYIARLVEKGYKVAVCEQMEDPALAKGLVKREVIQIVTPGTVTSQTMLHENENNYLASVYMDKDGISLSYCDISTGELFTTEETGNSRQYEDILNELVKINPKEILISPFLSEKYGEEDIKAATGGYIHMGFVIEPFGGNTYIIREIPTFMDLSEAEDFAKTFANSVDENTKLNNTIVISKLITKSCKSAVKAHDHLSTAECEALIKELSACRNPFSCPHGRPTFVKLSEYEIEKLFKRV